MKKHFNFFTSLKNALGGLWLFLRTEPNGWIEMVIGAAVIILSVVMNISAVEWILITACISMVIALEMINTSIEKLSDLVEPGYHPVIEKVKDISAGAVLWTCIGSVVTALIIFIPKFFNQ